MSCLLAQKRLSVTAIDISEPSLALFSDRASQLNIRQMNMDLFDAGFSGYDALISQEVLEHIPDFAAAIGKMSTFLRKDGYALFCVPYKENLAAKTKICPKCGQAFHTNGHLHHFTIENLSKAVEDNKFKILTVRRITNKRAVKWLTGLHLNVNSFTLAFDSLMNLFFPHKATYFAILAVRVD
jgi:2-polyprenyl-3-methyl-5-hydroxy-6-metoxy-1,4-benzoquinol methylase